MRDERRYGLLLVCRVGLRDRRFDEGAEIGETREATEADEFAKHDTGKRHRDDHHQAEGEPADPILAFERNRDKAGKPQTERDRGQRGHCRKEDAAEAEATIDIARRQSSRRHGSGHAPRRGGAGGCNDFVGVGLGGNVVRLEDARLPRWRSIVLEGHAR